MRGILFFKWSGCLTICELCCVPTSCPVYCLALPLPVSPPPQKSTSKICKLLPVVTSNVKKTKASNTKNGVSQNRGFPVPECCSILSLLVMHLLLQVVMPKVAECAAIPIVLRGALNRCTSDSSVPHVTSFYDILRCPWKTSMILCRTVLQNYANSL